MNLLITGLCMMAFNFAKAQTCTTLYSTSFDTSSATPVGATGWTGANISGTGTMGYATTSTYPTGFSPKTGAGMAFSDAYFWSNGAVAYMASPAFNLSSVGSSGIGFSFWFLRHAAYTTQPGTVLQVYANTSPNMTGSPVLVGTYNTRSDLTTANQPIVSTAGWYQYGATIPNSMRTSATYLIFRVTGDWYNNLFIDDFTLTQYAPQTYQGLTAIQPTTAVMSGGLPNQVIIGVPVATKGLDTTNLEVSSFSFSTSGTFLTSNIDSAKVFYTGNSRVFAATNQFGSSVSTPSGTFTVSGSRNLNQVGGNCTGNDTSWFWLAYDISITATNTVVNALCTSVTIGGTARTPAVTTNPGAGRNISSPLSGVYTINPTGSGSTNYTSFAAAITDLTNVGILGPVTFNVTAATYTGQVVVPATPVAGASSTNTITFDGGNGNATTRILTSSTANGATLVLNGCKYYTFKNLTVTNTVSGGGTGVGVVGTATNDNGSSNAIRNCRILLPNVGFSTAYGILVSASANGYASGTPTAMRCDSVILDSNTITGGASPNGIYYGIVVYGSQNSLYNRGLEVTSNTLTLGYYMGFQLTYIYNPLKINYNNITMSVSYGYYGMYNWYNQSNSTTVPNEFIGNTITNFGGYGAYLYFNGSGGTTTAPLKIYNNLINNGTNTNYGYYGIYLYSTGATEVYHNTTRMTYANSGAGYSGFYYQGGTNCIVKNNLFAVMPGAGSTVPAYFQTSPAGNVVNYNLYYNGANTTLLYRGSNLTSSNYRTATGGGDTSFFTTTSPFVSTTNFNLQNGCFGKGFNLTSLVPADITRFTRNVPPDLGAFEFQGGGTNDLSMDRLITPSAPITLGTQDLVFRVKNIGTNAITSFDANYTLNSGFPVNQTWSGTLASCDTVSVTFTGGQAITLGTSNAIKVYTANPNSSVDPNRANDTISVTYLQPMIGAYTINPSAAASATNFQTFGAADTALQAGIAGPVYFTVSAGTYTGQVRIRGNVIGASAINNIVFDGVSSSTTTLTASLNQGATLLLDKCKYVTFRNFTITNTISGNGVGVGIISTGTGYEGSGCGLVNNVINLPNVGTNTSYGISVTSTASGFGQAVFSADSLIIDSNIINNGYFGINLYNCCTGSPLYARNIKVRNNTLNNIYYYGMYVYYVYSQMDILNNTVNMSLTSPGGYGIYYYYNLNSTSNPTRINGNKISNGFNGGLYVYYPINGSATFQMHNNAVLNTRGSTGYACYLYMGTGTTEVYNNSFVNTGNTTNAQYASFYYAGTTANVNVKNNIFACTGTGTGLPAYFGSNPTGANVNYNTYYNAASTNLLYRGTTLTNLTYKTTTAGGDSSFTRTSSPFTSLTNLALTNGCSGKGVTLSSITTDILGNTRNTPPDMGAYEFNGSSNNDVAIDALLSPVFPVVAGSNDVIVRVRNTGANTVSSFDVSYTINGGTAVSTTWSGTLAACDTVSVTIPTPFTVVNNVQYALKVFTSNPNSSLDPNRGNDTVSSTVATPMTGTYTIGATASDYTTFNNAVAALQLRGVVGPVIFNVRTGVYNESVSLPNVAGTSSTNTVTFTSLANNKDSVRLAWSSATGNPFVLQFAGNFFKVNAITIQSTSTGTNNDGVNIGSSASFDTLSNCNVRMPVYNTSFIFTQYSINANNVSGTGMAYINNNITGSYYGVYYFGVSSNRHKNTYWKGNTFDSAYYAPFYYNYYGNYTTFDGNTFRARPTLTTNTSYMYWYYLDSNYTFTNNVVDLNLNSNGQTYWYNYYRANTTVLRGLVANNSIASTNLNMYWGNTTTSNIDFFNNSFNTGNGYFWLQNTGLTNVRIRNNIFAATGLYGFYISSAPNIATLSSDYNNYFSTTSTTPIYSAAARNLNTHRATYPLFDKNSVSYRPAYTSANNLTPNVNDTAVWVMNGRGEYLGNVTTDINGAARPANLAAGAPDLGAYNVTPSNSTLAPMAIANPATPTAGTTQVFTFGLDTVASITWDAFTTPPTSIAVRQYAGRAPQTIGTVTNYMNFYTDIQAPAGTYLYDIKLNYRDNWMGTMYTTFGFTEADLRLAKKDAATAWSTNTGSIVDSTMNTLTGSGYTSFSWFTGSDLFNQLPVKLTTFNGKLVNADALLNWNTASEINSNSFVIERSIDGVNFEGLSKVKAAGNSSSLKSYKYADANALALVNKFGTVYYRLKMVDNDGSFEYSKTIEIKTDADTKESVKVNPNPFNTELTVSIETLVDSKATLEVVDINGKITLTQNVNVSKGTSAINVDGIEKLKQGVYFVRVSTDLGTQVFKLVKN